MNLDSLESILRDETEETYESTSIDNYELENVISQKLDIIIELILVILVIACAYLIKNTFFRK